MNTTPITVEQLQQELMNLILTLQWSKTDLHQDLYYDFAAVYSALDQYADENDIDICDIDRCFNSAKEHTAQVKAEPKTAEELYAQLKGQMPPFNKDTIMDDVLGLIRNRKSDTDI